MTGQRVEPDAVMDCERIARDEIAELYVAGRLTDADAAAFEDHFFGCDRCFAHVEAWRTMGAALRPSDMPGRPRAIWRPTWWIGTAAAVVIGAALLQFLPRATEPSRRAVEPEAPTALSGPTPVARVQRLAALSQVAPPAYAPLRMRSPTPNAMRLFREAMTRYQSADYAGTIPGLEAAATLDASLPEIPFFLGTCLLQTGDAARAIDRLKAVIALGDTAYAEDVQYYLAKALLRTGDVAGARAALGATVAFHGDREVAAAELLRELALIDPLPGGRR